MYDPRMSAEEAQKALRDLVAGISGGGDINQDVDEEEGFVEGFRDGIVLLPHQIIGRKWMAERETGKKSGGLLADDMG